MIVASHWLRLFSKEYDLFCFSNRDVEDENDS